MKFKRFKRCLLPKTKSNLLFNQKGVCSARYKFNNRSENYLQKKEEEFVKIVNTSKNNKKRDYVILSLKGKIVPIRIYK